MVEAAAGRSWLRRPLMDRPDKNGAGLQRRRRAEGTLGSSGCANSRTPSLSPGPHAGRARTYPSPARPRHRSRWNRHHRAACKPEENQTKPSVARYQLECRLQMNSGSAPNHLRTPRLQLFQLISSSPMTGEVSAWCGPASSATRDQIDRVDAAHRLLPGRTKFYASENPPAELVKPDPGARIVARPEANWLLGNRHPL